MDLEEENEKMKKRNETIMIESLQFEKLTFKEKQKEVERLKEELSKIDRSKYIADKPKDIKASFNIFNIWTK